MTSVMSMVLPPIGMRCGLSREVPRIVPPMVRMPDSSVRVSVVVRFSIRPRKPSRKPITCMP